MPVILFASIFILTAAVPEVLGFTWPKSVSEWLWKVYNYSMGALGLIVAATSAKCLSESMNRKMPKTKGSTPFQRCLLQSSGFSF